MIVILKQGHVDTDIDKILGIANELGFKTHVSRGTERSLVGIIGDDSYVSKDVFASLDCVEEVIKVLKPYKLVTKYFHPEKTVIDFGNGINIGEKFEIIAGPCAVESLSQIDEIGAFLKEKGMKFLRGGAFKPRTSPYSFQGLGKEGLEYLKITAEKYDLKVVSEILVNEDIAMFEEYVDIIQVGSRNAQNFKLLQSLGNTDKPVFLKRGYMNTVQEFLQSAEYIINSGNWNVMLCERGIRTFENSTRNTLDISAVPVIKGISHLPLFVDPSHAAGKRELVPALSYAAVAAGADGIMVEIHPDPEKAVSDGRQSLTFDMFENMVENIKMFESARNSKPVGKEEYKSEV